MEQNENTPKRARDDYDGFNTFKKDLAKANITEKEVAKLVEKAMKVNVVAFNNDYKYDIVCEDSVGNKFTVEIKEDFTCARTGNVGLEYSCRGKDSGITRTEADFYVYRCHLATGGVINLLMSTHDLKALVSSKKYFRTVNGGDPGSNSLNYLFKLNVIKNIATEI